MKKFLGDFNAKVDREDIFKQTIRIKSSQEISNDNEVRAVNFATLKNLVVRSTMFHHCNIHKYTWTSCVGNMHNQIVHVMMGYGIQLYLTSDLSGGLIVLLTII
jgi:hypothetical protein